MAQQTAHRIWSVPEMVGAILSQLPAKDLFFSKAVCKTWSKIVDSSTILKQTLFLVPEGEVWPDFEGLEKAGIEPKLNPILRRYLTNLNDGHIDPDPHGKVILHDSTQGCDKIWRHMLLVQPPIAWYGTFIRFKFGADEEDDLALVTMQNARGITMGDLTRALEKEIDNEAYEYPEPFDGFCVDVTHLVEYEGTDEDEDCIDGNEDDINEDEERMNEDEDEDYIEEDEDYIDDS